MRPLEGTRDYLVIESFISNREISIKVNVIAPTDII